MRIFLTGASGMVGKNILEHPSSTKYEWLTPSSKELDLRDSIATHKFITQNKPDCIIHLAAKVGGIKAQIDNPLAFLVDNIEIGKNVVLGAQKSGVEKLFNISSACIYPANQTIPLHEDDIFGGLLEKEKEAYALAKLVVLRLCEFTNSQFGTKYKSLIPSNLYGRWDNFEPNYAHMIAAAIRKIKNAHTKNHQTVDIWGNGEQRREFMYAGDFADFIFFALTKYDQIPTLLNVGVGIDYSINEYYKIIADAIGYKGDFEHNLTQPTGTPRRLLDCSRLNSLGWQAKTSIISGINLTHNFFVEKYK